MDSSFSSDFFFRHRLKCNLVGVWIKKTYSIKIEFLSLQSAAYIHIHKHEAVAVPFTKIDFFEHSITQIYFLYLICLLFSLFLSLFWRCWTTRLTLIINRLSNFMWAFFSSTTDVTHVCRVPKCTHFLHTWPFKCWSKTIETREVRTRLTKTLHIPLYVALN